MQPGEILIYTDILGDVHEVEFIRASDEAPTLQVHHGEKQIWIRHNQAKATGRMAAEQQPGSVQGEKKEWILGSDELKYHIQNEKMRRKKR